MVQQPNKVAGKGIPTTKGAPLPEILKLWPQYKRSIPALFQRYQLDFELSGSTNLHLKVFFACKFLQS